MLPRDKPSGEATLEAAACGCVGLADPTRVSPPLFFSRSLPRRPTETVVVRVPPPDETCSPHEE